jgi:hypothetical protein
MTKVGKIEVSKPPRSSIVASCRACSQIVACALDEPEYAKDNAKSVASWIRDGLKVSTMTSAEVRTAEWCTCL